MRTQLLTCATLLCFAACDNKAPPAPRVHPVQSPTSKSVVVLTGAAEFASKVKVTGGASEVEADADPFTAEYLAEVPLNTTIPAGEISVKNTLSVTATDASGNTSPATVVEIVFGPEPGKPAKLDFTLTGAGASGTISAGDTVTYTYSVTDAYGGPVVNPLEVIPSWPGALVFDDGISGNGQILGMTRAGAFTITARASGATAVSKVVNLTVNPAAGKRYVDLGLTLSRMGTNDSTAALTVVKDLYNNVIIDDANGASAGLTLSCTPQATSTPASACAKAGNIFTIIQSGVYKITATYDDGTNPASSASAYVFVEDVPDVQPPTAHIDSIIYPGNTVQVPRGGRIETQLTLTDNRGLATATLYGVFGGNPACRANSVTLLLTGATTLVTNASLTLPGCAYPFDSIALFVQVVDEASNQAFSAVNSSLSVSSANLGNLAGVAGYGVGVFFLGGNGLDQSVDLAFDPVAQTAYVVEANNNRILAVLPDRTSASLRDSTGQAYQPNQTPAGIALAPAGDLFISRYNTGAVSWIPPTLPQNPASLATGLFGPGRLVYDARPASPVLCAARTSSGANMNCYAFSGAGAGSLTKLFGTDVIPNPAPIGANTELVGIAVGAKDASNNYTLWLLYGGCALYTASAKLDTTQPTVPALVTVTGGFTGGSTCTDVAALPSGDVAVVDTQQRSIVRVTPTSAITANAANIVTGLSQPAGLDFAGGNVWVLDHNIAGTGAVLKVTAPAGSAF